MAVAFVPKGTGWGPCKRGSSPKSKAAHKDADCYYQDGRESELHCGGTMTSPHVGEAREKGEGKLARPAERQCANTATNAPPHSILIRSPLAHAQPANGFCPVLKDRTALSEYSVRYQGRQFYFCCEKCLQAFNSEPEKYLPAQRQTSATDAGNPAGPVTRKDAIANEGSNAISDRLGGQNLVLISLSLLALVLWFFRRRSNRTKQRLAVPGGLRISTFNIVLLALLIGIGWSYYRLGADVYLNSLKDLVHFRTFEDFGDPPVPAKPPVPPRIKAQFYRGMMSVVPCCIMGATIARPPSIFHWLAKVAPNWVTKVIVAIRIR